jgi:hypothetical protein
MKTVILLLFAALTTSMTSAFVVVTPSWHCSCPVSCRGHQGAITQLHTAFLNSEDLVDAYSSSSSPTTKPPAAKKKPRWIELPIRQAAKVARAKKMVVARSLEDAELVLGRVAMVAALILFGTELIAGISLPEQLSQWVTLHQ